jgi:2-iminobutanoate/2-iminopropanoate deaminase
MNERKTIRLKRPVGQDAPFSEGVWAGNTFYLSGHIGLDEKTGRPPASVQQEVHAVMESLSRTLAAAGLKLSDLVFVQVFCSDVALFEEFNAVYRTFFADDFPARAFIGSGKLLFGARFEVQGIAVRTR